jgi:hypothetical protein
MQTETEREIELLRARVRMLEDAAGHAAPPERFSAVLLGEMLADFGDIPDDVLESVGRRGVADWLRGWFARNRVLLGRLPPPLDPLGLPPPGDKPARPEIVCLCGSTRFKQEFIEANFRLTMAGNIVLTVGWFSHADGHVYAPTESEKAMLDELHLRKIDLCRRVFVVNPIVDVCDKCGKPSLPTPAGTSGCCGGWWSKRPYVGESTRREVAYALAHGKGVEYLEPPGPSCSPETLARRRAEGREDDGSLGG